MRSEKNLVWSGVTPETMTLYEEAAKKGAALLDAKMPGWREKIDLDTLDMSKTDKCLLALLFNGHDVGAHQIGMGTYTKDAMDNWYIAQHWDDLEMHGFMVQMSAKANLPPIPYAILTAVWINLLTAKG